MNSSSSYHDGSNASRALSLLRSKGVNSALNYISSCNLKSSSSILLSELYFRLSHLPSPRILIDGLWFSRPYGGISRVWVQILETFALLEVGSVPSSPLIIIDRSSSPHFGLARFPTVEGAALDPLDYNSLLSLPEEISAIIESSSADIFCSSWISTSSCDFKPPSCPEISLVHDCIPEHYLPPESPLLRLRDRWISASTCLLAVSSATSSQLSKFYSIDSKSVDWVHPHPFLLSPKSSSLSLASFSSWQKFIQDNSLPASFVLLPSSGALGTYKNPDIVLKALSHPSLASTHLVISGLSSGHLYSQVLREYPHLSSRVTIYGFSDDELNLAYRYATAVIHPSFIEGFGLPVIEVIASGGLPLVARSSGLVEAASSAALSFDPHDHLELVRLISLASHPPTRGWLLALLKGRYLRRLSVLNPDLLGLALLASARRASATFSDPFIM